MVTDGSGITPAGRKNRRDFYLIIGIFVFVLVASTALYKAAERGAIDMPGMMGTSNNGVLIKPPVPIDALALTHADGTPFDFDAEDGAWTLLVPVSGACTDACAENLYLTRQVRTALGRDAAEVKRLAVVLDAAEPAVVELIEREHPGTPLLTVPAAAFEAQFATAGLAAQPVRDNLYFLVDPYGWVMMYYTPAQDGKELMADLKFLLKYAPDREKE